MGIQNSEWRVSDAVLMDELRVLAAQVASVLLERGAQRASAELRDEVGQVRRAVLLIDGFDRTSVLEMTGRLQAQLQSLEAVS